MDSVDSIVTLLSLVYMPSLLEPARRPSGLPDLAARALDAIASDNASTSSQIIGAGATAPLVKMLGLGKSAEAQRSSAGLLATLAEVNQKLAAQHVSPLGKEECAPIR